MVEAGLSQAVSAFGGYSQAVDYPAEIMPALKRGIVAVREGKPALADVSVVW
jgi:hypothetical protein